MLSSLKRTFCTLSSWAADSRTSNKSPTYNSLGTSPLSCSKGSFDPVICSTIGPIGLMTSALLVGSLNSLINKELINEKIEMIMMIEKIMFRDNKNNFPEKSQKSGFLLNFSKRVFCSIFFLVY